MTKPARGTVEGIDWLTLTHRSVGEPTLTTLTTPEVRYAHSDYSVDDYYNTTDCSSTNRRELYDSCWGARASSCHVARTHDNASTVTQQEAEGRRRVISINVGSPKAMASTSPLMARVGPRVGCVEHPCQHTPFCWAACPGPVHTHKCAA